MLQLIGCIFGVHLNGENALLGQTSSGTAIEDGKLNLLSFGPPFDDLLPHYDLEEIASVDQVLEGHEVVSGFLVLLYRGERLTDGGYFSLPGHDSANLLQRDKVKVARPCNVGARKVGVFESEVFASD